jgi:GMP synthase (glutamine-hydrolysing)
VRLLHVEHPDGAGPGVFADVAPLETWRAWEAPPPDGDLDAIVLYGGATNVVDAEHEPWLRDELAWLGERLADGVPVLGVCLGGQLLAHALGAEVTRCTTPEIGWRPVHLTEAGRGDPVTGALPAAFDACQWHSWRFDVPGRGELLATSDAGPQAFRHGRSIGVQFHPEVDRATLTRWIEHFDADPDAVAQGYDPQAGLRELDARIDGWNALGRRLFSAFVAALA